MSKPNNWYQMNYEEQKEWKRIQDEIENVEWESRRAQEEADKKIQNVRKEMRQVQEDYSQDHWELSNELHCAKEALRMIMEQCKDEAIVEIARKGIQGTLNLDYGEND
jgi:hypothetical protein